MAGPVLAGPLAFGVTSPMAPTFTATTTFPATPNSSESAAAPALASLGPLAALAAARRALVRAPADQYVALMPKRHRVRPHRRQIQADAGVRGQAANACAKGALRATCNHRGQEGRPDHRGSLTTMSPQRAADMPAQQYVDELRYATRHDCRLSEAQQRRVCLPRHPITAASRGQADGRAAGVCQASGFGQRRDQGRNPGRPPSRVCRSCAPRSPLPRCGCRACAASLADDAPEMRQQQATLSCIAAASSARLGAGSAT